MSGHVGNEEERKRGEDGTRGVYRRKRVVRRRKERDNGLSERGQKIGRLERWDGKMERKEERGGEGRPEEARGGQGRQGSCQ